MSDTALAHGHGPKIVIAGAGSVGCFVGGLLARGLHDVTFLMRSDKLEEISRQGLMLSDYGDLDEELPPDSVHLTTDPASLASADIILVSVKSGSTQDMAGHIARFAPKTAVVVSLQNGIKNVGVLRDALPNRDVRAGIVLFNVVSMGGGHFHRGTSGDILIERGRGHISRTLSVADLEIHERKRMRQLQLGKLLINLNNGLNALSGLPLKRQINEMRWRRLIAAQMSEALRVLDAAGLEPVNPVSGTIPISKMPSLLRLPTLLFRLAANIMVSIDPHARSSMWDDLKNGRSTEIDELQGEIVSLAKAAGIQAPINQRVFELIKQAEAIGAGSPHMNPKDVRGR
ncbi:2-dehydropantoate 2-reductase [Shimia abyssi]|uniref:2-dehydropantoate 2-reductase n=1 Tax=Shimia abyssi TaxID=1662395 RepID=A0A2P8F8T8_9RHOB|nr:2-dehydropantoate 2-reductase [Shimia abyssi]PSL18137.1 ketopantoate reductase [Shimia abyssi]